MKYEDIFKEFEELRKRMTEDMFSDFNDLEGMIRRGEMEGEWSFEPIERPGMKGFIARGFFSTPRPLERPEGILPPLRPKPNEPREPLYDISVAQGEIQAFIELPGVEEDQIRLDTVPGSLRLKAGDFEAEIDLSRWALDTEKMEREYRNGVLKVRIPRAKFEGQLI